MTRGLAELAIIVAGVLIALGAGVAIAQGIELGMDVKGSAVFTNAMSLLFVIWVIGLILRDETSFWQEAGTGPEGRWQPSDSGLEAAARVRPVISMPPSMRASSVSRSASLSGTMEERVRPLWARLCTR